MKKLILLLPLISFSSFADSVSPQNYVNQVKNDCDSIQASIDTIQNNCYNYIYPYINSALINIQNDSDISAYAKQVISGQLINAMDWTLDTGDYFLPIENSVSSLKSTANRLVLDSGSGSGNNYYSNTNFYYTSSSVTNIYYTSSFVTNIYNSSGGSSQDYSLVLADLYSGVNDVAKYLYVIEHNSYDIVDSLQNVVSGISSVTNSTLFKRAHDYYLYLANTSTVLNYINQEMFRANQTLTSMFSAVTNISVSAGSDYSSQIATITDKITSINQILGWVNGKTKDYTNQINSILSYLSDISTDIDSLSSGSSSFFNIWTNSFYNLNYNAITHSYLNSGRYYLKNLDLSVSQLRTINGSTIRFSDLLTQYAINIPISLASLNNYLYGFQTYFNNFNTHFNNLVEKSNDISETLSDISLGVGSITNEIKRQFSIFDVSSPLMDFQNFSGNVTNQYYHFLTNYYIKVSTGRTSGSASESHTNWFSRVEMLLGALVFKDSSDGSFSPGGANTDSLENAYETVSQSLATAVEIPLSFQSKLTNAEQSLLDYMREWHSIISSGTLASHFTLCDVQLPGYDGNSSANSDGVVFFNGRMNLSVPIEGSFKNFLDVSRALSTVCLITLFLILSLKLIIFLLRACASITRVSYALFMAIAGH